MSNAITVLELARRVAIALRHPLALVGHHDLTLQRRLRQHCRDMLEPLSQPEPEISHMRQMTWVSMGVSDLMRGVQLAIDWYYVSPEDVGAVVDTAHQLVGWLHADLAAQRPAAGESPAGSA
jgi:hypothetical protein